MVNGRGPRDWAEQGEPLSGSCRQEEKLKQRPQGVGKGLSSGGWWRNEEMPFPHCGCFHTTAAVLLGHRCFKKGTDESKGTETLVGDCRVYRDKRLEESLRSHPHSTCPLPPPPHALGLIGRTCPDQGDDNAKGIRS